MSKIETCLVIGLLMIGVFVAGIKTQQYLDIRAEQYQGKLQLAQNVEQTLEQIGFPFEARTKIGFEISDYPPVMSYTDHGTLKVRTVWGVHEFPTNPELDKISSIYWAAYKGQIYAIRVLNDGCSVIILRAANTSTESLHETGGISSRFHFFVFLYGKCTVTVLR
ncbi:MAG: hypothetical protein ACREGH_00455, partial [Minisyncoccia bacterium]